MMSGAFRLIPLASLGICFYFVPEPNTISDTIKTHVIINRPSIAEEEYTTSENDSPHANRSRIMQRSTPREC